MRKILIVDDEVVYLQQIFKIVNESEEDYRILRAMDVESAYAICEKIQPDIVITDWEMPGISGIDFVQMLKSNELLSRIPVVMCTGIMTNSLNLKTALDAGAVDFVRKPIDEVELLARIKSVLSLVDSFKTIARRDEIITTQKNEILQNQVDLHNRELVSYSLLQTKSALDNEDLLNKLTNLQKLVKNQAAQQLLTKIIHTVKLEPDNINWDEFKNRFETVHPDFFKELLLKSDKLSTNELKLCAFLRLNMSSKEISRITHQSTRAIEVARYRIRKKFSLESKESLHHFLHTL